MLAISSLDSSGEDDERMAHDGSVVTMKEGIQRRFLVQLTPIQQGVLYLALDNTGDLWEMHLRQGQMATMKQVSLWRSLFGTDAQENIPQSIPWP